MRNLYTALVGEPKRKRSTRRPGRGSEDSIKMDLREMEGLDWIYLTQQRDQWELLMNTVTKLRIP